MRDKFKRHLRDSGLKVTAPRTEVFEFLEKNDLTTISAVIGHCGGRADRASIYRTIGLFRELGIIHDVVAGGKRMIELSDRFASHHHHLSCLRCGKSEAVSDRVLESDLDRIAQKNGFRQVSHQIEISGICARCQRG